MSRQELTKYYTPSEEEVKFAKAVAKGDTKVCIFLIYLKVFQDLNYFPLYTTIPKQIIQHMKDSLHIRKKAKAEFKDRSIRRYKQIIRSFLNTISDREQIKDLTNKSVEEYEPIMENSADVFNAVLEKLIKNNCEIPAFSTLERWIKSKQAEINNNIFRYISNNLTVAEKSLLDSLLESNENTFTSLNYIKELPKSATLKHMKEIRDNYLYLKNINIDKKLITNIHPSKINNFSSQVSVLDASEVKNFSDDKRYTFMICFIHNSMIKTSDDLITMFIKRLGKIHNRGKEKLNKLLEKQRSKTEKAINIFHRLLLTSLKWEESDFASNFNLIIQQSGGYTNLLNDCKEITAYNNKNYYPLLWSCFKSHRKILFEIIKLLPIRATTKDNSLIKSIEYLISCETRKSDFINADVDISFTSEKWRRFVITKNNGKEVFVRRHFEMCIFSYIAFEFKTGDLCVENSEEYANYRKQLLPWDECKSLLESYCADMNLPNTSGDFIKDLQIKLEKKATLVDKSYINNSELIINGSGEIILKRKPSIRNHIKIKEFKKVLESHVPERNIMEILCNIEHWTNFTRHFGPLSGADSKFSNPRERYILLTFGYGSNMGPTQTSKHVKGSITPHMIQFTNQRHITEENLDNAITDVINCYNKFSLPKLWGDIDTVAADGTKLDLYMENLLSEYHIRYGGYGGIAYHHVSDRYIALFSHFIPCGVWEAVYIIDGLLKNKSDIQPNTIHADTQGQSATVFALTHLLGIKLMPRIRNWKELKFYRAHKDSSYKHIDKLFKDTVNWNLIETHYEDLFQVILSIKTGKILPSTLLRKLNNYSKKNKLYQAFRELGNVIRTVYLLEFISNIKLREKITESTNKTESYNAFSKWFFFGGEGVLRENDIDEQTKIIKYNDLLANAVILHNIVDMNTAIKSLKDKGIVVSKEDIKNLSPYITSHIKRFGEYIIDLENNCEPINNLDIEKLID